MKKATKIVFSLVLCLAMILSFASCKNKGEYNGDEVQGVTVADGVTTIKVGNTAATSGATASVGLPFNYGLEAYLWYYSTSVDTSFVFDFKHYDDEFSADKGLTYTKQLVEQDKVFALVGHFGTNTVAATADYIVEKGVPMVYAATGVGELYNNEAKGYEKAIMPVQPIYNTEGRSMFATAIAPVTNNVGLGGTKVGIISTTDDAGINMKEGIKEQVKAMNFDEVSYQDVDAAQGTDYSAAVNALKLKGCDVVIIAAAQTAFTAIATQFVNSGYDNVKIITSYVSANAQTMGALATAGVITATRKVYSGAWLDTSTEAGLGDYMEFVRIVTLYAQHKGDQLVSNTLKTYYPAIYGDMTDSVSEYFLNSYAMAGYIAGNVFCTGLTRIKAQNKSVTWLNYINAMESAEITIPMGAKINLANGRRLGVTALSLNEYTAENAAAGGQKIRDLTDLDAIVAAIGS